MNRAFLTVIPAVAALCVRGQDALTAFTNRADQLLRHSWGFGVNEIPIYCSTNPLARYSGGIHALLQKAVDAYDLTNHTPGDFDFPSVFRPQFAVITNGDCVTAVISNWVEVTTNYADIVSRPLKTANDSTLSADDNVRGIGLIIGYKLAVPVFDEFSYANTFNFSRKLHFDRTQPGTRPFATNQIYALGLSNIFGCSAVNMALQPLARDVTIYLTNSSTITLTNELGAGVTNSVTNGVAQLVLSNQWAKYRYSDAKMFRIFSNSTVSLPASAYIERTKQFNDLSNLVWEPHVGQPVHSWIIGVTNDLLYALVDNSSGRILDFVSYGSFGTSIDVTQLLQSLAPSYPSPWLTNGADSSFYSPPSVGVLNQIAIATNGTTVPGYTPQPGSAQFFSAFVNGTDGGNPSAPLSMDCPYIPSATIRQTARWWAATESGPYDRILSPGDHFTLDEMGANNFTTVYQPVSTPTPFNPLGFPGSVTPIQISQLGLDASGATLRFDAYADGQYGVWSSPNLVDWEFVGLANRITNYTYTLLIPKNSDSANLFFHARKM